MRHFLKSAVGAVMPFSTRLGDPCIRMSALFLALSKEIPWFQPFSIYAFTEQCCYETGLFIDC